MVEFVCPNCGTRYPIARRTPVVACHACGKRATLRPAGATPFARPRFPRWAWVVVAALVLYAIGRGRPAGEGQGGAARPAEATPELGDAVVLGGEGQPGAVLAIDGAAYDALYKAAAADDRVGMRDLERSGRIFWVAKGTQGKLIDVGWMNRRVRVTEGPHKDEAGWVAAEHVKPAPAGD